MLLASTLFPAYFNIWILKTTSNLSWWMLPVASTTFYLLWVLGYLLLWQHQSKVASTDRHKSKPRHFSWHPRMIPSPCTLYALWSLRMCSLMKHAHCRCQEAKARDHTYYDGLVWKNKLDMNQNETKCSFIHALNILKYLTIRGLFLAFKLISLERKYQTMSTKWSDKTSFFLFFAKVLILGWDWLHESYHAIYTMAGNIRYWIKNVSWNLSA